MLITSETFDIINGLLIYNIISFFYNTQLFNIPIF